MSFVFFCYFSVIFTARCYADRGIATAKSCVRPSVTLRYGDHIGWSSSKIISPLVSLAPTSRIYSKGNTQKFWPE